MKRLTPQGEWLRDKIFSGHKEIVIIFMGHYAKNRAASFLPELPFTICLPYGTSPYSYQWPVQGCYVYLVDTSISTDAFIKTFVICLFRSGAEVIEYLSPKTNGKFKRN